MKAKTAVVVFVIFVLQAVSSAFVSEQWEYQAQIITDSTSSGFNRLMLPPELYDLAKYDLSDIRIITSTNQPVPYILARARDFQQSVQYSPKVLNRSTDSSGNSLVTLDFQSQVVKNSIEVITAGNNFRRQVKIEGSNDNIAFFTLVPNAYVFAIGDERNTRFNRIGLPENDYRYLRITVSPMPGEQQGLRIENVLSSMTRPSQAERQTIDMTQTEQSEDDRNRTSVYTWDMAWRNLPVSEITLGIADDTFYRYVSIYGRNESTRQIKVSGEDNVERFSQVNVPWDYITGDTLYSFAEPSGKKQRKSAILMSADRPSYRYIKVIVSNYDDAPLKITSASAGIITHQIVFPATGDAAMLYVGSKQSPKPRYDLEQTLKEPLKVNATTAQLGSFTENPQFGKQSEKPVPWTEKHKSLLWTAMILIAGVLAGFMLRSFRSIQNQRKQDNLPGNKT